MAKAKAASKKSAAKKAKEPIVELEGVSIKGSVLSKTPVGKTFSVTPSSERVADNPASNEEPKEATPPNVIWSGEKKEDGSLKFGNPPAVVKVGIRSISVPEAEKQLAGFYSPDARALVRNINGYKFLQPKG